jgi:integrase
VITCPLGQVPECAEVSTSAHSVAITSIQLECNYRVRQSGGIFERPRRSGAWWIDYRDGAGKRHREKIGSKAEAIQVYTRRLAEVRDGKFVSPRAGRAISFRELALEAKRIRLAPLSYETDLGRLDVLLPQLGAVPAAEVTPELLEKIFTAMRRDLSGPTVNRYRSLISSVYSFAVRTGKLAANPVARVTRFRENAGRVRYLKQFEEILLRATIQSMCPDREPEFDLALYTGMRRGEELQSPEQQPLKQPPARQTPGNRRKS